MLILLMTLLAADISDTRTFTGEQSFDSVRVTRGGDVTISACKFACTEIIVEAGGKLTVEDSEIVFRDSPIDTAQDPEQLGHGLIVRGTLRVNGKPVSVYQRFSETKAGDTSINLPDGKWYLIDTRQPTESRNLAPAVQGETTTVTDGKCAPLAFSHLAGKDMDGKVIAEPIAANLDRSVVFRSENPSGTRAHAYFTEHADVQIEYAAFLNMGRATGAPLDSTIIDAKGKVVKIGTNQKGRYAVHFHHCHGPIEPTDRYQFRFVGNLVYSDSCASRWGITVHQSHYGLIADNVVINCAGSGIVTEDGNESENIFERNLVCNVTGDGRPDARPNEIGYEGAAYWFRGGNNIVRNNIANGCAYGYTYYARFAPIYKRPETPGGEQKVPLDPKRVAIREFSENEVAGATQVGFSPWWIGVDYRDPIEPMDESVIDNLLVWGCRSAVSAYESGKFVYHNLRAYANPKIEGSGGWGASDYLQYRVHIEGGTLEGFSRGISAPAIADKLNAGGTNPGLFIVRDTRLRCRQNLTVPQPWHNATAQGLPPLTVHLDRVAFEGTEKQIVLGIRASEFTNYAQWATCFYHGPGGWNLRFFSKQQAPTAIMPATSANGRIVGSPEAGLTNEETWRIYGVAYGGEVLPTGILATQGVDGYLQFVDPDRPILRDNPNRLLSPGQPLKVVCAAYNPNLRPLDFRLAQAPEGATIENRSGILEWPDPVEGLHEFTIEAVDESGVKDIKSFWVRVAHPTS